MLDLSPGDGTFGKCAMERDLIYVAVCFNEYHAELLKQIIMKHILAKMTDEKSTLYDARFAVWKKKSAEAKAGGEPEDDEGKGKKRKKGGDPPKPKPKAKGAKKNKKSKKAASSSSSPRNSSSDSHSGDE